MAIYYKRVDIMEDKCVVVIDVDKSGHKKYEVRLVHEDNVGEYFTYNRRRRNIRQESK